jgi:hypothetical protein
MRNVSFVEASAMSVVCQERPLGQAENRTGDWLVVTKILTFLPTIRWLLIGHYCRERPGYSRFVVPEQTGAPSPHFSEPP